MKLMGSEDTSFDCCDMDKELSGCEGTGDYGCCVSGEKWVEGNCVVTNDDNPDPCSTPPCTGGQERFKGKCVEPCAICEDREGDGTCSKKCPCPFGEVWGWVADKCMCVRPCSDGEVYFGNTCIRQCEYAEVPTCYTMGLLEILRNARDKTKDTTSASDDKQEL